VPLEAIAEEGGQAPTGPGFSRKAEEKKSDPRPGAGWGAAMTAIDIVRQYIDSRIFYAKVKAMRLVQV
jgi:hypothetical protein